jgi:hypothetical protein
MDNHLSPAETAKRFGISMDRVAALHGAAARIEAGELRVRDQNLLQQSRAIEQQEILTYLSQVQGIGIGANQGAIGANWPFLGIDREGEEEQRRRPRISIWRNAPQYELLPCKGRRYGGASD